MLITGVVLTVVLALPSASTASAAGTPGHAPHGVPGVERAADPGASAGEDTGEGPREHAAPGERPVLTAAAAPATCEQRATARDLPDAVPGCALRLAAWEQPWWPLPRPHPDPLPEQVTSGELPPTRAPPLTAPTTV